LFWWKIAVLSAILQILTKFFGEVALQNNLPFSGSQQFPQHCKVSKICCQNVRAYRKAAVLKRSLLKAKNIL